jgi:hypothetical protein
MLESSENRPQQRSIIVLKKTIASVAVGGILLGGAAGAIGAGTANAATPAASSTATASGKAAHPFRAWLKAHRKQIRRAFIAGSAKAIGITPQQLVTELKSGKSVATVAGEHNISAQTVITDLVNGADARINQAVTDHKLTVDQAQKLESLVPAWVTKAVNHTF